MTFVDKLKEILQDQALIDKVLKAIKERDQSILDVSTLDAPLNSSGIQSLMDESLKS